MRRENTMDVIRSSTMNGMEAALEERVGFIQKYSRN